MYIYIYRNDLKILSKSQRWEKHGKPNRITSLQYPGTTIYEILLFQFHDCGGNSNYCFMFIPYLGFHMVSWSQFNYSDIFQMGWFNHHQAVILLETPAISLFPSYPPLGPGERFRQLRQLRWCRGFFVSGWMAIEQLWTQVIPHRKLTWPMEKNACLILNNSNGRYIFKLVVFFFHGHVRFRGCTLEVFHLGSGIST